MKREPYIIAGVAVVLIGALAFLQFIYQTNETSKLSLQGMYVPFDESMQLEHYASTMDRPDFSYVYNFFKDIYEKNSFDKVAPQSESRIPKIIHVMWLGGKLPEEYVRYVESWKKYHPKWTILFWTDSATNYNQAVEIVHTFDQLASRLESIHGGERIVIDVADLQFDNRGFYDKAINYGEKSDILKWEIVYRFGGVYVDVDFECLRPLDVYHHTYDLYTGIQPLDTNMVQLGAALYGAVPHHPILRACVENIKNNQHINQIVVKTGPIHFTKTFLGMAGKTGLRDIALPASYFYPCGYEQKGTQRDLWCKAESAAVHHWAGSWLKPEAFVRS